MTIAGISILVAAVLASSAILPATAMQIKVPVCNLSQRGAETKFVSESRAIKMIADGSALDGECSNILITEIIVSGDLFNNEQDTNVNGVLSLAQDDGVNLTFIGFPLVEFEGPAELGFNDAVFSLGGGVPIDELGFALAADNGSTSKINFERFSFTPDPELTVLNAINLNFSGKGSIEAHAQAVLTASIP